VSKFNLYNINLDLTGYSSLINLIIDCVSSKKGLTVSYANANSVNLALKNNNFLNILNRFDIVHHDGIGVYLALKFFKVKNISRFTGSDFYEILKGKAVSQKFSCFFFGHDDDTLNGIKQNNPGLIIAGAQNGYNYNSDAVVENIISANPDIIFVGLSQPLQEIWANENKDKLKNKIIICVGDGIKVFAGSKIRGPVFIRRTGFEWLVRLFVNPVKYWKRYLIGNPLFLYRIIKIKIAKFSNHNIII
jgi:N-acetylglucosaminyldiphosphoundecaprenol N-acetyl-beta-D-mannosaminyltransferase